ncbi:uncharacterized protein METZ01_LOCUS452895, partial [marine metagenome]
LAWTSACATPCECPGQLRLIHPHLPISMVLLLRSRRKLYLSMHYQTDSGV